MQYWYPRWMPRCIYEMDTPDEHPRETHTNVLREYSAWALVLQTIISGEYPHPRQVSVKNQILHTDVSDGRLHIKWMSTSQTEACSMCGGMSWWSFGNDFGETCCFNLLPLAAIQVVTRLYVRVNIETAVNANVRHMNRSNRWPRSPQSYR